MKTLPRTLIAALLCFSMLVQAKSDKDKIDVTLTAPVGGAVYTAPATLSVTATAIPKHANHAVVEVQFHQGVTLVGSLPGPQAGDVYSTTLSNVIPGTYSFTATAADDKGDEATAYPVTITVVQAAQTITGFNPTSPLIYTSGGTFALSATGGASGNPVTFGTTTPNVCGVSANTVTIQSVGNCVLTADQTGDVNYQPAPQATATVQITTVPTVSLNSPANNERFTAPANIALTATASEPGGSIAKVEFYNEAELIGAVSTGASGNSGSTYTLAWTNVPQGNYAITAKATDPDNLMASSAAVSINVEVAQAGIYYIHSDNLGTPRTITRPSDNALVWEWKSEDPFGANLPNENPSGLGQFVYNLRFPGQYYDAETGTHFNWARDYDPNGGRYIQSDPIGLMGGISTYAYVKSNPLKWSDPEGLKIQQCCREAEIAGGILQHCWLKTDTISAGMASSPQCRAGVGNNYEFLYITDVYISDHTCEKDGTCVDIPWDVDEECVNRELKIGKYLGKFSMMNNCQTFANEVLNKCTKRKPPPKKRPDPDKDKPCCGKK